MFIFFESIDEFLSQGGQVLWFIFFVTLLLWAFIIERFLFFKFSVPKLYKESIEKWKARGDRNSTSAHFAREYLISKLTFKLKKNLNLIKVLVAICPMLGLLGTVTGMITVFEVMAAVGTGNAKLMAEGISKATIPTMAGMVASLSGYFFGQYLYRRQTRITEKFLDQLLFEK